MEVAEHIPSQFEAQFLMNLVQHAKKGILLSWGVPGQQGVGHVNCESSARSDTDSHSSLTHNQSETK